MLGLLNKAWADLRKRRLRSLLTVLGIAIGVAGVLAVVSTGRNVAQAQRTIYASASQADITFWVWRAPATLAPLLRADGRIGAAELRVSYFTRGRLGSRWSDLELIGIEDFADVRVNQISVVAGQFPGSGEILLEATAGAAAGLEPGMEISFRDSEGRERYLRISGLSRSPSTLSTAITRVAMGYVPASFLRAAAGIPGNNQLLIRLNDVREARAVAERIERLLRRQGIQAASPSIRDPQAFPGKREVDALLVVMAIFAGMSLLLSAMLVVNTLSASVMERIGEIGVLKAIGGTRWQVLVLYEIEALAFGLAGAVLGVALGAVGGWRLVAWIGELGNARVRFGLTGGEIALGARVGTASALGAGLLPAMQGMRVPVREALESYGISTDYGQGWLDRQFRRLVRLPPLAAMAVRSLSRRTLRSGLTIVVIALAAAAFLSAAATRDSVNRAIDEIYTVYGADAWVWLNQAVSTQFEDSLRFVSGVQRAEGWLIADGTAGLAECRLWGIPPRSTLYRPVMQAGRWFRADENDVVVLSAELAEARGHRVGERIEIQTQGRWRRVEVVGIAIDNTIFLGGRLSGKAFLPRATLGRLLQQEDRASFFALSLTGRERAQADAILAQVEDKFRSLKPTVQPVYVEIESAQEASRLLTLALAAMVLVVAAVGGLGIVNTLGLNVLERRREIAVMRALGATDSAVVLAFLVEGLGLGAAGWLLGAALAYPAGRLFTAQLERVLFALPYVLSARMVLWSAGFALVLATVASLGPALAAAHVPISGPLRYE